MHASLHPYPTSPLSPVEAISVRLDRDGPWLWLRFVVEGRVDGVRWPEPTMSGRADELWRHTCFEAFIADEFGYREYNLSPSGQWASYCFEAYRKGMRVADEIVEIDGLDAASDMVALEARIPLPVGPCRIGLTTVIEDRDGEISYWALAHPSDKPDFHHPDSFVLELPALETS